MKELKTGGETKREGLLERNQKFSAAVFDK